MPLVLRADCPQITVGVLIEFPKQDELIQRLNETRPEQPAQSWLYQIQEKILSELRMNSPDIAFSPVRDHHNADTDYIMTFHITTIGAGEDIEIAGIEFSEYTGFIVVSELEQVKHCNYERAGVISAKSTVSKYGNYENDVFITIEHNIDGYGSIQEKIEQYEESHPVPPRGPRILVTLKRKFVSPLSDERKMEIRIKVKNCKGKDVWDHFHGLHVKIPRKTERGEISENREFASLQGSTLTDGYIILSIQSPEGASITYTLKKGMEMGFDKLTVSVCGMRKEVSKDVFIPIAGIALKAESEGYVFPEETTKMKFSLKKIMPWGEIRSLSGKTINLSPEGLIDGTVSPSGRAITQENGYINLIYKAGLKETTMTVHATYQPKGYEEKLKESASVTVIDKAYDWFCTVIVNQTCSYEKHESNHNPKGFWLNEESTLYTDLNVHLSIRFITGPGKTRILGKSISGTSLYQITTWDQKSWADCKDEQTKRSYRKRPGDEQKTILKGIGSLIEENLDIMAAVDVDRKSGKYEFEFGVWGMRWNVKISRDDIYTDACNGETTKESYHGEEKGEKYSLDTKSFEGYTANINDIFGSKRIESPPWRLMKCKTDYTWHLERIKK